MADGPEGSRDKGLLSNIMHSMSGDPSCITAWQLHQRYNETGDAEPLCSSTSFLFQAHVL